MPSAPSQRRTAAPDIVGLCLLLYAATLSFAVMRAPYLHKSMSGVARDVAIYGGLLLVCALTGIGVFQRRTWALGPALVVSLAALAAGAAGFHVPETAQLPAGVLGVTGLVFLLARRGEFMGASAVDADQDADEGAQDQQDGEAGQDAQAAADLDDSADDKP